MSSVIEFMVETKMPYPLIGFMLAYLSLFVLFGHFDALDSVDVQNVDFMGLATSRGDVYFFCLAAIVISIYVCILMAYKIAQSKKFSFKEFAIFSAIATAILPVSVWGLAWIRWFDLKTTGSLILWQMGKLKISIPWNIFMPVHIVLTAVILIFFVVTLYYKNKN
jgi:hypothetical protein